MCPSYTLTEATASLLLYHCLNVGVLVASATPNYSSAIFFHQSSRRHRPTVRHGMALLRQYSSPTTCPHGGTAPSSFSISNNIRYSSGTTAAPYYLRAILLFQPRHGFLRHYLLAILLPQRHLVFHFPTTRGTPTFNVHKQVAPILPYGFGGRNLTYGLSSRTTTSGDWFRRPEHQTIFNTLRAPFASGQSNASLALG